MRHMIKVSITDY